MAHTFAYLGLLVLFAVGSNAWLFSSRPTSASATHGVNEECMQHGRDGSCEFYECFEERLPCGRDWYIRRIGDYYCDKMQRLRSTFTPAGQTFLDDTTRCLTTGLLHHYQANMVDCHNLKHDAIANISRCYIDHAFCSIFNENAQQFFSLFEPSDLVSRGASSIWVEMMQLAGECGTEAVASLTSMASQSVTNVAQSVWQSLTDAFSDD